MSARRHINALPRCSILWGGTGQAKESRPIIEQRGSRYCFPPGIARGYGCIGGPAHVFYSTSGASDLANEVRLPHEDASIEYDWLKGVEVR
jgi:hypothetical protein